jgi:hypothetical protein
MKKKLHLLNFMLMGIFISCILITPNLCGAAASDEGHITVMNPAIRELLAPRVNLKPRLDTLEGRTLYLVDMNYEGMDGTPVMGEIQKWFTENMPDVKTVLKVKKGNYVEDDPDLWKEIRERGADGVIMGVAG